MYGAEALVDVDFDLVEDGVLSGLTIGPLNEPMRPSVIPSAVELDHPTDVKIGSITGVEDLGEALHPIIETVYKRIRAELEEVDVEITGEVEHQGR